MYTKHADLTPVHWLSRDLGVPFGQLIRFLRSNGVDVVENADEIKCVPRRQLRELFMGEE